MIKHKFIVGFRNKVSELAMECDSAAAINGAKMSRSEREYIQEELRKVVEYIDNKLFNESH